jgi:hypothetical protein
VLAAGGQGVPAHARVEACFTLEMAQHAAGLVVDLDDVGREDPIAVPELPGQAARMVDGYAHWRTLTVVVTACGRSDPAAPAASRGAPGDEVSRRRCALRSAIDAPAFARSMTAVANGFETSEPSEVMQEAGGGHLDPVAPTSTEQPRDDAVPQNVPTSIQPPAGGHRMGTHSEIPEFPLAARNAIPPAHRGDGRTAEAAEFEPRARPDFSAGPLHTQCQSPGSSRPGCGERWRARRARRAGLAGRAGCERHSTSATACLAAVCLVMFDIGQVREQARTPAAAIYP